jgi:hypothetical protein
MKIMVEFHISLRKVWNSLSLFPPNSCLFDNFFVQNCYNEIHKSPINDLVADSSSQADRRPWYPHKAFFFFLLRKEHLETGTEEGSYKWQQEEPTFVRISFSTFAEKLYSVDNK